VAVETITTQVSIQRWVLSDTSAMLAALTDLSEQTYQGTIQVAPSAGGTVSWTLEIVLPDRSTLGCSLSQVLVLMSGQLTVMSQADYTNTFGSA
jgi:hypothetical protein